MESLGNRAASRGDIRVERLEQRLQPRVPFPHRHDFHQLILQESGRGWHEIEFTKYPAASGQAFYVKPGEVHAWKLGRGCRGLVVEFTDESLPGGGQGALLKRALAAWPSRLMAQGAGAQGALGELLLAEAAGAEEGRTWILQCHLVALLLQIKRANQPVTGVVVSNAGDLIERFRALVETHFRRQRSVEFYARLLKQTPKALTMKVARRLGQSARALILTRVLVEAKRLLAYSDAPVAAIAEELGFESASYFGRFFRQQTMQTPGAFRAASRRTASWPL